MELLIFLQRKSSSSSSLCFLLLLPLVFSFSGISVVEGYKNYTVGDSSGWYAAVNYQKWADAKKFSLGDFLMGHRSWDCFRPNSLNFGVLTNSKVSELPKGLVQIGGENVHLWLTGSSLLSNVGSYIFNTDTNHSVVQTYNLTTYKLCDYNDALENDKMQWSAADPSNTAIHEVSVAVPLVREGMNYFFSGDYDGEQCKNGQHFKITVSHGQGLPKSLQNPAVQSPSPASGPGRQSAGDGDNDDGSVADTIVPASFDRPKEDDTATGDHDKDSSGSLCVKHNHGLLFRVFIFLGFLYCCLW